MTICELYIETHWNRIRSQIPWNTQTPYKPRSTWYHIPDGNYSVEKNIWPVKKHSKPFFVEKIPTASEVV